MKNKIASIVESSASGSQLRIAMVCCLVISAIGVYLLRDGSGSAPPPRGGMPVTAVDDSSISDSEGGSARYTGKTTRSREIRLNGERINPIAFGSGDFEVAWDQAVRSGGTEEDRLYNLSLVVGRMGGIADPNQVLEKIVSEFGPGRSRCHLVSSLFMASGDADQLATAYNGLEYPDERTAACLGISHNLCMIDWPETIDRGKYAFLGDRFDEVFQKSLELYVSRFQSESAANLSTAVSQALSVLSTIEDKQKLISRLIKIAPFDCWEQATANKLNISGSDQKILLSLMFAKDATVAMERVAAVPGGEKYISSAIHEWLRNDASKPIEWLESHQQTLSLVQKESAMLGIAEYSARQGDCNVAWQWVGQITDPKLRKAAEGQVWSMERDIVRREVSRNPESAIQSMISENSKHKDYWIEEAVATWTAREPAKAQAWYQKNWNSLPANKAQYVAAAFANQAASQGDTAAARQWATFIQDAKTKQRIEAGIAKAEAQSKN